MKQAAIKRTARLGVFVLLFFLGAAIASPATLQSYMFTKSLPPPCTTPNPVTSASVSDQSVILWFYLTGLNAGDVAASRWVDPSGNEYATASLGGEWMPVTTSNANMCFFEELLISGQPPATRPGTWTVTGYLNNSAIFTLKLTISQATSSTVSVNITQVISTGCPVTKLLTSVTNNGSLISGLTSSNFTLKEDGVVRPVTVTTVSSGSSGALSVALLIDASGSVSGTPFNDEKAAAKAFVNLLGSTDAAAIYSFESTVVLKQDYSSNKVLLAQAIDAVSGGGDTNLYGAIIQAAQGLLE